MRNLKILLIVFFMAVLQPSAAQSTYQMMDNETKEWIVEYVYIEALTEIKKIEMSFENSDIVFYWTITAMKDSKDYLTVFLFDEVTQKYFHMKLSKINGMILIEINDGSFLFRHISDEYLEH